MNQPLRSLHLEPEIEIPDWDKEKADSFQEFADEVFSPIYPYLCQDISKAWGRPLKDVRVLEIGGGPGNMAVELLKSDVAHVTGLDVSESMLDRTVQRLKMHDVLADRFRPVPGEASRLPFPAASFDLVFSRGSMPFWPDIQAALGEMQRVLGFGGMAYVGGGFGLSTPLDLKDRIHAERERRMKQKPDLKPIPRLNMDDVAMAIRQLGGEHVIVRDGPAFWIQWFPHGR